MSYTPTEQQIEKAAERLYAQDLRRKLPTSRPTWENLEEWARARYIEDARALLVAVAPSIAAGALRDAAAEIRPSVHAGRLLHLADQIEQKDRA